MTTSNKTKKTIKWIKRNHMNHEQTEEQLNFALIMKANSHNLLLFLGKSALLNFAIEI